MPPWRRLRAGLGDFGLAGRRRRKVFHARFFNRDRVPVIVIVGGGFAGIAVARRLERRFAPDEAEIVLFGRENYTLFTPMLPEVTSGELEVRHVVTPIRDAAPSHELRSRRSR